VIALHRLVLRRARHLGGDQADIADVMLRAGMMAAGEMDIERRVDLDAALAPVADFGGMTLGVGCRELAAGISRTRDEAGANLGSLYRQTELLNGGGCQRNALVAHA